MRVFLLSPSVLNIVEFELFPKGFDRKYDVVTYLEKDLFRK